jgi:hypothetical protein
VHHLQPVLVDLAAVVEVAVGEARHLVEAVLM